MGRKEYTPESLIAEYVFNLLRKEARRIFGRIPRSLAARENTDSCKNPYTNTYELTIGRNISASVKFDGLNVNVVIAYPFLERDEDGDTLMPRTVKELSCNVASPESQTELIRLFRYDLRRIKKATYQELVAMQCETTKHGNSDRDD